MKSGLIALVFLTFGIAACQNSKGPHRIALLAGASGELPQDSFFIEDLRDFHGDLKARGWQVRSVVGSKAGLLPGSKPATNQNLIAVIRETLRAAKKDDRVLLVFHAHGKERETPWGQRSHSLMSEDRDAWGGEPGFDLDEIEPEILRARNQGATIALIDLSCYSGATQALREPACRVTLASPRYVSLCSGRPEERLFSSRFFELPAPEKPVDLETHFLSARRQDQESINLPQISSRSTPAALAWDALLVAVDPLDVYENLKSLRPGGKPFDPAGLLSELHGAPSGLRAQLSERLKQITALRRKLEEAMPALARDYDGLNLRIRLPGREPLPLSPGVLAEFLKVLDDPAIKPEQLPDYTQVQRRLLSMMKPLRHELEREFHEPLAAFRKKRVAYDLLTDQLAASASALMALERQLYDVHSAAVPDPNPCHGFKL